MSDTTAGPGTTGAPHPLTKAAVGLAVAEVVSWVVLIAIDHEGPGWFVMAGLALAAAVVAWRAGGTSTKNVPALVSLVIGVLGVVTFLGFVISDL